MWLIVAIGGGCCVVGYVSHRIHSVFRFINDDVCLRPVDWPKVLGTSSLRRLAWTFANDPRLINEFAVNEAAVDGVSLFGTNMRDVHVNVRLPLRYAEGRLQIDVTIENGTDRCVLIPPFQENAGLSSELDPQVLSVLCASTIAWFSSGAQLLEPGQSLCHTLTVEAPARPMPVFISFVAAETRDRRAMNVFELSVARKRGAGYGAGGWEDLKPWDLGSGVDETRINFRP